MQKKNFSLKEIAALTGSELIGNPEKLVSHVSDLENATANDLSFLANPRYEQAMRNSNAGAIFMAKGMEAAPNKNFLLHDEPSRAFQQMIELFYGKEHKMTGFTGIHETAVVHSSVKLESGVEIGPLAVIDEGVVIGKDTKIGAGCIIGPYTVIGSHSFFHPRVTVRENCVIGNHVVIQPGAVIGSCGFGFITDKNGRHTKLNQVGNVIVEDHVEIGANTTIDRARFKSTKIGQGTIIDNLVQIAHGVTIGKHTIIVSQTGIAGSTEIEDHVVIAGQVAINGHIKICKGTMLAARAGVAKSIDKPGKYGGYPARPLTEYNRSVVRMANIESSIKEIKELKKEIAELKKLIH
ncbi:MAG TPA: UDP-3-O-(3-hydroxymyristoyl)glucosamine N-acyltransferase [Parachlamydiaceae bacterium]|nr:UDP-3-O-(3-hydroxymyristoyl)glucosamine N-acyltransferase [Parachlamydiaceae bacterium]